MTAHWMSGDTVTLAEVYADQLWSARPMTVVEDTPERAILWKPHGTLYQLLWPPSGYPREPRSERIAWCMERQDWVHELATWPASTLWFLYPERFCSIWCSWYDTGEPWG
jgi:hypothetical protein